MILESTRLTLRPFNLNDVRALAEYRSDPEVARYQGWDPPMSATDATRFVEDQTAPMQPGWYQHAIDLNGHLIGDIGVNLHDNRMQADIGYTVATKHQRKGYATEAVARILKHLFTERGLHRVSAECDARNVRSALLLQRLGFQQEGHRRENTWVKGEWTDDLLFGLLANDYDEAESQRDADTR